MNIEQLIKKLKSAPCIYGWQRKNVLTNIRICEMQIGIRKKYEKTNSKSWNDVRHRKVIMSIIFYLCIIGIALIPLAYITAEIRNDEEDYDI